MLHRTHALGGQAEPPRTLLKPYSPALEPWMWEAPL